MMNDGAEWAHARLLILRDALVEQRNRINGRDDPDRPVREMWDDIFDEHGSMIKGWSGRVLVLINNIDTILYFTGEDNINHWWEWVSSVATPAQLAGWLGWKKWPGKRKPAQSAIRRAARLWLFSMLLRTYVSSAKDLPRWFVLAMNSTISEQILWAMAGDPEVDERGPFMRWAVLGEYANAIKALFTMGQVKRLWMQSRTVEWQPTEKREEK